MCKIDTGSPTQCSVMTQMSGMGVGGREAEEGGDICIFIAESCCLQQKVTQHFKAIIFQLKFNFFLNLKEK